MSARRRRVLPGLNLAYGSAVVVATLTVAPGRAKSLPGGLHLVIFAALLFLAANP